MTISPKVTLSGIAGACLEMSASNNLNKILKEKRLPPHWSLSWEPSGKGVSAQPEWSLSSKMLIRSRSCNCSEPSRDPLPIALEVLSSRRASSGRMHLLPDVGLGTIRTGALFPSGKAPSPRNHLLSGST